jgi:UDP-N-acetylmuramoylalanine--D-glutamate ligase
MRSIYADKNILILGLGKSGVAAAKLLHHQGARVIVNDKKNIEHVENEVSELKKLGIEVIVGYHPENLINNKLDLIVKNPGIPYQIQPLIDAISKDIPIITEIELAYKLIDVEYIGITGSNGKTTTTSLVGEILCNAGLNPVVGGNIGTPLSEIVLNEGPLLLQRPIVLELSSFQLQGIQDFRCHIAAILNIYETHLDYHGNLENYMDAKNNIFRNQQPTDYLILNGDQSLYRDYYKRIKSDIIYCSSNNAKQNGFVVDNGEIVYRTEYQKNPICSLNEILIPGKHNIENALFASAISVLKGVPFNIIRNTLINFKGVEHRIEYVGTFKGARFYNDSKATNQQATIRALESFRGNIILIAGGLDRGNDFNELIPTMYDRVKALIVLGETANKLRDAGEKAGIKYIINVNNLEEAVIESKNLAKTDDIILLSPACASWDMFSSFEERGSMYKKYILKV